MHLDLSIAGERLRVVSSAEVLAAMRQRYGAFEAAARGSNVSAADPIELRFFSKADRFAPRYERPLEVTVRASEEGEIVFESPVRGEYSPSRRAGSMRDITGIGAADVLVRTALSLSLPDAGAVLLHGAALKSASGAGIALCGASGAGKSTAAAAFGAFSDELIALRPTADGVDIESTPYWSGRPSRRRCERVVCLQRGSPPGHERLWGAAALRVLSRHVVRYSANESADRAILQTLGKIAERAPIMLTSCPEGRGFLPFLAERLGARRGFSKRVTPQGACDAEC